MSHPLSFASSLARAWKSLKRRPAFFVIAVSSLAIALGLATTVIAQIDSLMHPYSPIRDVGQMYAVWEYGFGTGNRRPPPEDVLAAFRSTGIFDAVVTRSSRSGQVEVGSGLVASTFLLAGRDYFDVFGVRPRLGRLFTPGETFESGVAIVDDEFWHRYLGNPPTIGNATFTYEGRVYRIVGVVGREWGRYRSGMRSSSPIWLPPVAATAGLRLNVAYAARLKKSISIENAHKVMESLAKRWIAQYGAGRPPFRVDLMSLRPNPLDMGEFHYAMIGAAIFILVIASANVSALMLARSVANRRDQALRLALGARPRDLFVDVTAEVGLIATVGATVGVVVAFVAMGIMTAVTPPEVTWLGFARINWNPRVFIGLFGITFVCIGLSTMFPAWYVTRIAPAEPLKESSGTTTGRAGSRFKLLVVGELALAMVLLLGASLISKTAHNVATFDFGYEARNVNRIVSGVAVVSTLTPPAKQDSLRRIGRRQVEILARDLDAVVDGLRATPDIRDAAWFASDAADRSIVVSQATIVLDSMLSNPDLFNVGPGFFRTLGLPIVEGRDFTEGDRTESGAAILDQLSARRLFPDGSAVGRMIKLGYAQSTAPWIPVVGVARNAIHELPEYPEMDQRPVVYVSRQRRSGFYTEFVYRAVRGATDVTPVATRTVKDALPPGTYLSNSRWLPRYEGLLAGRRFTAGIFITLSLASLILATAGLFGVLSYAVNQRMREFSLRVALGAQRNNILGLVAHDGLVMVLGGTAIGAFVGMYAAFSVYYWLWGVYPVDAVSLVIAELVLLAVTAVASAIPALRAVRANPAEVMRAI
jgi:predicted permease